MSDSKSGPLTIADLVAIWQTAVDKGYGDAFVQAGEGQGFEAYTQAFAQYARVSQAIDVSSQACYVLPWSGQTNPSAQGAQLAQVALTISRSNRLDQPLVLGAGLQFFEEQTNDWGPTGPVPVLTGRRYVLTSDLVFLPGDTGPFTVQAVAEKPGYGYNNPLPGTISVIDQPGTGFNNTMGVMILMAGATPPSLPPPSLQVKLITDASPDTIIPEHVGQYVAFSAGANTGVIARVVGFSPPVVANDPSIPGLLPGVSAAVVTALQAIGLGSTALLEDFVAFEDFGTATGTFTPGELVTIKNGSTVVGSATFVVARPIAPGTHQKLGIVLLSGAAALGNTITGVNSGATATLSLLYTNPSFTAEAPSGSPLSGGASWRVLDWVVDWGLSVTNAAQPSGGRLAMLDAIGADKNLPRSTGEPDAVYAQRIWQIADVETPNAVKRTLNRVMGAIAWCFREVGSALLPGMFYDRTDQGGDAYDYDTILFNGSVTSGTFIDPSPSGVVGTSISGNSAYQEPVQFMTSSGLVKSAGYFGRLDNTNTRLTIIRKSGQGTLANPVELDSGDVVVGLVSGAVFTITSLVTGLVGPSSLYRNHFWLDYADSRAMFMIGVPRLPFGEFGFAWSVLPAGSPNDGNAFYDATTLHNFYDGFPALAPAFYQRVWNAIERIRAGGVGFYLYQEDGTCT